LIADTGMRVVGFFIPLYASIAMAAAGNINQRSMAIDAIRAEREAAIDWYAAVRSAYTQYRASLVADRREATEAEYDVYPGIEGEDAATR